MSRMRRTSRLVTACCFAALASSASLAAQPETPAWCATELETLSDGVCYFEAPDPSQTAVPAGTTPVRAAPDTLVIFLHPLTKAESDWQWEQQRTMWTAAKKHGFSVLAPRGRRAIGPGRSPDVLAWPTSPKAQELVEDDLLEEWKRARTLVERRRGRPFAHVWVFGFSNGAYYATSLAVRDRFPAEGYGVFAGGSGGKYTQILGAKATHRAPIFVGYGTRDPAQKDMKSLVSTLKTIGWRFQVHTQAVGHIVTYEQLRRAVHFLARDASASP
jgi:predicted esterase